MNSAHISSCWDKRLEQNILRLHLVNGRHVILFESDVNDALEALGLSEFVEDWVLDLEKDQGSYG